MIYLLGAGRSGTTLLATVLNSHSKITTIGEMHQFYDHLIDHKKCSCGEQFSTCSFWGKIVNSDKISKIDFEDASKVSELTERHRNIPFILMGKRGSNTYYNFQNKINYELGRINSDKWYLDSSKFIARYLLLKRNKNVKLKGIYLVRDVRGVIHSFSKKVQTQRSPVSTLIYYGLINFYGQIIAWMDRDVIKIKYEEFVENPSKAMHEIFEHVFEERLGKVNLPKEFEMAHIIGGNRMRANKKISINSDEAWKQNMSKIKKTGYYILSFPLMILNKYNV